MSNTDVENGERRYEEDEISLIDLVAVLWKHRWLIICITLIAAASVVAYSIYTLKMPPERSPMPNQYTAEALVMVNGPDRGGGLQSAISQSGLGGLANIAGVSAGGQSFGQLAVVLLEGKTTLDTIADEFDIAERYEITEDVRANSRKAIRSHASFQFESETGTLTISYESIDPEFSRDVANRFVEILQNRFEFINTGQASRRRDLLEEKLTEVEAEVERLANQVQEFQSRYGTLNAETLAQEQVEMTARLRSQLIMKEVEIQTYRSISRVNDPALQRLQAERRNMEQLLNEMEQGYSEYQGVFPSQQELPQIAYRFNRLQRELNVQEQIYSTLRQQYEVASLNAQGQEPIVQVLEEADAPQLKSGPSRSIICMVVTVSAFFLAVFLAFVLEYVRKVKNDPDAMRRLRGEG